MENVGEDFARLHGTAQGAASGFDPNKTHPLFGAVHSIILAQRYGRDPYMYLRNPGLRAMDTRQAAFRGLQKVGQKIKRYRPGGTPGVGVTPDTPAEEPKKPDVAQAMYDAFTRQPAPGPTVPPSNWIG